MKSKTILSEEERDRILYNKDTDGYEDANKVLEALIAAEEEVEQKNAEFAKVLSCKVNDIKHRNSIIERLHNENQALIEENAGLKVDVKEKLQSIQLCERVGWKMRDEFKAEIKALKEEILFLKIPKHEIPDTEMLFHTCKYCDNRCNCNSHPCKCCE